MQETTHATQWIEAWHNDPDTSLRRMKQAGLGALDTPAFEQWATRFDAQSFNEAGKQRTQRIMNWITSQIGTFQGQTILDVGAASGVFSIPFAQAGAQVTSLEPSQILQQMLKTNADKANVDLTRIDSDLEQLEVLDDMRYDLVFASMCPAITDWSNVFKLITLSRKYVYVSLMAGAKENKLVETLLEFLNLSGNNDVKDMYYLMQILYFKNYTYQTLIEYHRKTETYTVEQVIEQLDAWMLDYKVTLTEAEKAKAITYLKTTYQDKVDVTTGGKFGKVIIDVSR